MTARELQRLTCSRPGSQELSVGYPPPGADNLLERCFRGDLAAREFSDTPPAIIIGSSGIEVDDQLMTIAIVLIVLAVLFVVGGLILKALWWMFVIAAILLVVGIVMGYLRRGRTRV